MTSCLPRPSQLLLLAFLGACAQLHHVQLSDIDDRSASLESFEVKVSETGINLTEAKDIAKMVIKNKSVQEKMDQINDIISLFQMGPRTGNIVFVENYAQKIPELIADRCGGRAVTGVTSIRESRKYPVISGEIVKIKGYCMGVDNKGKAI